MSDLTTGNIYHGMSRNQRYKLRHIGSKYDIALWSLFGGVYSSYILNIVQARVFYSKALRLLAEESGVSSFKFTLFLKKNFVT
jgi:uncharacterized membrane protein